MNRTATDTPAPRITSQVILDRRRVKRVIMGAVYLVLFALVVWSIQVTVIEDTDWERLGGLGNVLKAVNRFVGLDMALFPNLIDPTQPVLDQRYRQYHHRLCQTIQLGRKGTRRRCRLLRHHQSQPIP